MEKTQKGPRTWHTSKPETQKKINKYNDSGNECCPGQPAIPGKKLRNLIRKLISTHSGRESNEQQARQIQKPPIILPNIGSTIFEHDYRLETPQGNSVEII